MRVTDRVRVSAAKRENPSHVIIFGRANGNNKGGDFNWTYPFRLISETLTVILTLTETLTVILISH